MYLHKLLEIEI